MNTNYTYDAVSNLLSVLHQAGSTTLDGASYTYDAAGNRSSKTNYLNSSSSSYSYDPLYQLLSATGATTESYTYDAVGNRLSSVGVPNYSYNASNELTSNSNGSYTYDANGNTLSDPSGKSYTWDFENRLTQAVVPGTNGGTTTFKYDPFGRRIEKISPTATSIFVYDGSNLTETVNASGSEVASYMQGMNIDEPLAMLRGTVTDYYAADGLGSVTSLSNSAGALANTYAYDSFGNLTNSTGTLRNPFQYTAREFDQETSLYYYRARYYDQATGKFLSEDPARFAGGTTFYQYAANNPLVLVDWTGNCPIDLNKFVNWLDNNANPGPTEWCSRHIRLGLQNAGANTGGAPKAGKDWGPFLTNDVGFSPLAQDSAYSPQVGDTAVFQPANGSNPAGHVEVWDGTQWVSDYKQGPPLPDGTHFYPNLRKYGPQPYIVYRCN